MRLKIPICLLRMAVRAEYEGLGNEEEVWHRNNISYSEFNINVLSLLIGCNPDNFPTVHYWMYGMSY